MLWSFVTLLLISTIVGSNDIVTSTSPDSISEIAQVQDDNSKQGTVSAMPETPDESIKSEDNTMKMQAVETISAMPAPDNKVDFDESIQPDESTKADTIEAPSPETKVEPIESTKQDDEVKVPVMIADEPVPESNPAINCWKCDSSLDMKCIGEPQSIASSEYCQAANGCYLRKDTTTERLIRGCSSELTSEQLEDCVKSENCHLCNTDACNSSPWPVCYTCMSSNDATCPRKQQTDSKMTICNHINATCLVFVDGAGETTRKCGLQSECEGLPMCFSCSEFLCNDVVYPENRRKCHQCNGSVDLYCEQSQEPSKQEVCNNYLKSDGCFYYMAGNKMVRGCVSDVGAYNECRVNGKSCMTCSDADGCNSVALYVEPTLSCIKCSADESSCAWKQPSTSLAKCEKSRLYFDEETCYSNFNRQIKRASRGCSRDDDTSMCDGDCKLCKESACNIDSFMKDECIVCDDVKGLKCAKVVEPSVCNEEGEYEKRGCFTIVSSGNKVKKGCISQLNGEELMKSCTNSTQTLCYLCYGSDSCNNATARNSSSTQLTITKIYWQFLIFLLVLTSLGPAYLSSI